MVNGKYCEGLKSRRALFLQMFVIVAAMTLTMPSFAGIYDPMRPHAEFIVAEREAAVVSEFNLKATMVSERRRVAVIDEETVSVGDDYKGYRVTEIEKGSVVLLQRGKKTQLRLQPPITTRLDKTSEALHHISGVD